MNFFKRKRNIYFSILFMLTVVMGLFSISFSYYVDESSKMGLLKINEIDNRLQSDALTNGTITVNPQETVEFSIYVINFSCGKYFISIFTYRTCCYILYSKDFITDKK